MHEIADKIVPLAATAVFVHAFFSFVAFWLLRKSIVHDIRKVSFRATADVEQGRLLPKIPDIEFQVELSDNYRISNYQLNVIERIGIPTVKALVGLTVTLWVLSFVLSLDSVSVFLNSYAPKDHPYPVTGIADALAWIGFGLYVAYFILLTRLEIVPLLCEVDERYKRTSPIGLLFKLGT